MTTMKNERTRAWLTVTAAAIAFIAIGMPAQAAIQKASVSGGTVEGVVVNDIASFKGIPFAAPPVGNLRWKPPQAVKGWSGTKKADAYAPGCVQDTAFPVMMGAPANVSEDCLYLNVWTPAKSAGEKLPVMVWIYGGAFSGGMTSIPVYDGTNFAKKGVVLVSVSYRVGPFGFLAHPQLSKESGKGSGNYGLQDQIAGLHWVKDNISRFGGDPGNVTIFGESAGGIAVSMLAASPKAKGLFQRAISESGGNFAPAKYTNEGGQNVPPLAVAENFGQSFLAKLGANDIKAARALTSDQIQGALGKGMTAGFWPVFDGDVLLGDQYELYSAGKFNDTPVLIGTNSDEGALFTPPEVKAAAFESQIRGGYGEQADHVLSAYPHGSDAEARDSTKNVFRDTAFAWPTWAWARLQSQKGTGKAYVYYFDHRLPNSPSGANHGAEIAFVFGNLAGPGGAPRAEDIKMSELLSSYWVNFAKNGDPNGTGLPPWPSFTDNSQQVMFFDPSPGARPIPNLAQLKTLDGYYSWRRQQAQEKTSRGAAP